MLDPNPVPYLNGHDGQTLHVVILDQPQTAIVHLMAERAGVSPQRIVQGLVTSGPFRDAAACHAYRPQPDQPDIGWNRPDNADRQRDALISLLLEMIGLRPPEPTRLAG